MAVPTLETLVARARAAWPDFAADPRFSGHLAARLPRAAERAPDVLLAFAAGHGDRVALRAFEERIVPAVERALARFGDRRGFVVDALQELRLRLFVGPPPRILEYGGTGSLRAWVKVAAVRVAINLRRRNAQHTPAAFETSAEPELDGLADPELDIIRERYRAEVQAALRAAFATLDSEERSLLRLYVVDRLNIAEIGRLVGVSRATVGRRIAKLRAKVLAGTRARLAATLGVSPAELDSLLRAVQSRLDLTLSQVLATPAGG